MTNHRLVAAIACRNAGSRLFGKPLQNLDVESGYTILENIVSCLKTVSCIDEIILAISDGTENSIFQEFASKHNLRFVIGDEQDVLSRLIKAGIDSSATDIFRITSESPFLYFEEVVNRWNEYITKQLDALFMEPIVDGCGFEIISLNALIRSHKNGTNRHRSEMCSLYIRENVEEFRTLRVEPPKELQRFDLRLTVDNPEDLVVCRHIFKSLKTHAPLIPLSEIILFLDRNPSLITLIAPFTESGYRSMFL
jgi:spore coat polysaccharide biosynthesis protein SpsF